jgi:hypothetical protein
MSIFLPRFLRSAYRREPLTSVLMTMGAVDAALGGASNHGGLLIVGIATFGGALGLRWLQSQRRSDLFVEPAVQHYLPPQSSQSELPMLSMRKKGPPPPGL